MADPPDPISILSTKDLDALALDWDHLERLDRVPLRGGKKPAGRSAAKVKLYRRRRRLGQIVLRVVVPECEVAEYLVASGRLTAAEALDRRSVERAIAAVVVELAARWPPKKV